MTGIRLAPQATLTPWHAVLIIVGTLVLALTKNKEGLDHCRCGVGSDRPGCTGDPRTFHAIADFGLEFEVLE
jgi:hypothetical protein